MSEERGTYETHKAACDDLGGVQHIGDLIRQIIDERDWPLQQEPPDINSGRRTRAGGEHLAP